MSTLWINRYSINSFLALLFILLCSIYLPLQYPLLQPTWLLTPAILFYLLSHHPTFKQNIKWLSLTLLITLVHVAIIHFLLSYFVGLMVYVSLFMMLSAAWQKKKCTPPATAYGYIALFTIHFCGFLTIIAPPPFISQYLSFITGAALIIAMQCLFFYRQKKTYTQQIIAQYLSALSQLSHDLFACLIQLDYSQNEFWYEERLHQQKIVCLTLLEQYQISPLQQRSFTIALSQLYELLLACAQLRWRVKDHSIFEVCQSELQQLAQQLNRYFSALFAAPAIFQMHYEQLQIAIEKFEEIYQSVLLVTAKEPVAFILFQANLKSLVDQGKIIHECQSTIDH